MKRFIGIIIWIVVALSAVAALSYWLAYFFAASGKKFCFFWGNTIPSKIESAARQTGACEDAV
jgi:hypothetical protein